MARRKFAKTLVFSLAWAIFLSFLITNWDALKSVQWRDLWETVKLSGISEFLKQNVGDIFFFGLCASFMILLLSVFTGKKGWHGIKESKRDTGISSLITGEDDREITDPAGRIIVRGPEIDISIDPGLTSMPSNVYHRWYADHQPKRDDS
jgi:hypothetical protein